VANREKLARLSAFEHGDSVAASSKLLDQRDCKGAALQPDQPDAALTRPEKSVESVALRRNPVLRKDRALVVRNANGHLVGAHIEADPQTRSGHRDLRSVMEPGVTMSAKIFVAEVFSKAPTSRLRRRVYPFCRSDARR
jgi:hypothetical protein